MDAAGAARNTRVHINSILKMSMALGTGNVRVRTARFIWTRMIITNKDSNKYYDCHRSTETRLYSNELYAKVKWSPLTTRLLGPITARNVNFYLNII